jgi:hypothetical protein
LLNAHTVLTAAHCSVGINIQIAQVRAGSTVSSLARLFHLLKRFCHYRVLKSTSSTLSTLSIY